MSFYKYNKLNYEFFIARNITRKSSDKFSSPIIRVAISSITIGLAVMIISIAIVTGYQKEIRDKVIGFGSHIQISHYDSNLSYESIPIEVNNDIISRILNIKGVKHIQSYAIKAGIIKADQQIQGIVLKGIDKNYDWDFFNKKIIEGSPIYISDTVTTNGIIISKITANSLKLKVGDTVKMYFITEGENIPRGRKFYVSGIYETGLQELDKIYAICDIKHIRKLNLWNSNQISGYEVLINDFKQIENINSQIYNIIGYDLDARTIKQTYPEIFDWIGLFNVNVIIILTLMVLVASINMITALLILILEKTNMIGILKTLGAQNLSIRKIFIYNGLYMIIKGLFWGNILALLLCLIQIKTGIITLNQESYYVPVVPINLNFIHIIAINVGTLIICMAMLIIPSYIVTRITPIKTIRFS